MIPCDSCGHKPTKFIRKFQNNLCEKYETRINNLLSKGKSLDVELIKGNMAPRYKASEYKELFVKKAVVTEQGTETKMPIVDFQMVDEDGNKYFFMITGKLVMALGDTLRGVIKRTHGTEV